MSDIRLLFGIVGIVIEVASMLPYFRDIFRGTTKPHVFTWFGWGLINIVVGSAQFVSGGGYGIFVTASVAITCFTVAGLALFWGEKNITKGDWICLGGSIISIVLWLFTSDPLVAVIIVTLADIIAFIPTFRKAYYRPQEETALTFGLGATRNIFGILALQSFAVVNWLYPASLIITDGAFTAMLLIRRRQLTGNKRPL